MKRDSVQEKSDLGKIGEVKIADDVVATIAGLAATEIEGVKGVRIEVVAGSVNVELSVVMKYGYSIPKTSHAVQDRVKSSIENMTGLTVQEVNIKIVGVEPELVR